MHAVLHREGPSPLRGEALVARLRGEGVARPAVDPGDAAGLRGGAPDALAEALRSLAEGAELPVRVTKDALTHVLTCEAHLVAERTRPRHVTVGLARGALVAALSRQWIPPGALGDPWSDGLSALQAGGDRDHVAAFVARMPADE